jgi:hypothetical protein
MQSLHNLHSVNKGTRVSFMLQYERRHHILVIRFKGVVTDEILLDGYLQMRRWFAVHGRCGNISDFTGVTDFHVTGRAIRFLASNSPLVPGDLIRIIVATRDDIYGMARMFEMQGATMGNRVDIVRNFADAIALAGIDQPNFEPVTE